MIKKNQLSQLRPRRTQKRVFCLVLILLALGTLSLQKAKADSFRFTDQDKLLHMTAAYAFSFTGTLLLRKEEMLRWKAVTIASAGTLALGLLKETFLDDEFSGADMLANVIGVAGSAGVVFVVPF